MMVSRTCRLSLLLMALLCQSEVVVAEDWQVVMNKHAPIQWLNQTQVRNLFMGNTATAGLHVFDSDDTAQRIAFYHQVLGLTENRWRAHWSKLVFTAQATPPQSLSTQEVLVLLQHSNAAIAYLPLTEPLPEDLKQVFVYYDRPSVQ